MKTHAERVNFLWSVADLLRDAFKRGKYQDVILPLTVLRRIDCVLEPTKEVVLKRNAELSELGLENRDQQLRKVSGYAFYNTSRYDFRRLLADAPNLGANLRNYIAGFSPNMKEVLDRFDFHNTITKLDDAGLLFLVLERFGSVDLHPNVVDNHAMGEIFEELIRRFNEALNENPGEHFTPRDVIGLMVTLMLAGTEDELSRPHIARTVYDPCAGSGGMLTMAKQHILEMNPNADVFLFGQEVNPETWAISKADLLITSEQGRDAENIKFGSSLSRDQLPEMRFEYLITNPPYGKEWKNDEAAVRAEHAKGDAGRFGAGLPRISDGQMLFLQHLMSKMKAPDAARSRVAIVMNGSPLFTGDAGSGESEIRRWILEHDWLEAIVQLPEQLFYNTGITTYVWLLTNRKDERRHGKVQLIDASKAWVPMRRSLGDKRRMLSAEQITEVRSLLDAFQENQRSKVMPTTAFGYRRITVERPLRLAFEVNPEAIERLRTSKAFIGLATSKRKEGPMREAEEAAGRSVQQALLELMEAMPTDRWMSRDSFLAALDDCARSRGMKLTAPTRKMVVAAIGVRDESAEVCTDAAGNAEPDPELRDFENVPLGESVDDYFEREVRPYVPDAWINTAVRDQRDGEIGRVGYEINFNRYFYVYTPPRPLEEIDAEIKALEAEILAGLREVTSA